MALNECQPVAVAVAVAVDVAAAVAVAVAVALLTCCAGVQDSERRANRLPPSIVLAVSMLARVVTCFECDGDCRYNKDPEWVAFNTLVETTKECDISFDKTRLIIYKITPPQIHARVHHHRPQVAHRTRPEVRVDFF